MTLNEILSNVEKLNESQKARLRSMGLNYLNDGDTLTVEVLGAEPGRRAGGVRVFIKQSVTCHALRLGPAGRVVAKDKWVS